MPPSYSNAMWITSAVLSVLVTMQPRSALATSFLHEITVGIFRDDTHLHRFEPLRNTADGSGDSHSDIGHLGRARADSCQQVAEKAAAQRQQQQFAAHGSSIGSPLVNGTIDRHAVGPHGALPRGRADLLHLYLKCSRHSELLRRTEGSATRRCRRSRTPASASWDPGAPAAPPPRTTPRRATRLSYIRFRDRRRQA